jgi:hypothetical protein
MKTDIAGRCQNWRPMSCPIFARAGGARENATEEAKVNAFVGHCGQSLDWIFGGDPRGLICKAAGNSPQSAGLPKPPGVLEKAQEVSSD